MNPKQKTLSVPEALRHDSVSSLEALLLPRKAILQIVHLATLEEIKTLSHTPLF